jgi:hypothetical protein
MLPRAPNRNIADNISACIISQQEFRLNQPSTRWGYLNAMDVLHRQKEKGNFYEREWNIGPIFKVNYDITNYTEHDLLS